MVHRYIPSIASQSLGNAAHHSLTHKLELCSSSGFEAIELFYEDLESTAQSLPSSYPAHPAGTTFSTSTTWQEQLLSATTYIADLCRQLRLDIICLQPFKNYGGLIDRKRHAERIEEVKFWILLAQQLGTDLIQVPSSFLPASECTGDLNVITRDMRELADLGLQQGPPIRFCYEALAFGTHINLWEQAWQVVKMVDRPNFGTCLDTFNLCGGCYADPASPSGLVENAEEIMQRSIKMLREELDVTKIFYIEVVDGERLEKPLNKNHPFYVEGQIPRMSWSRNARLFPFEERGYLPIVETLQAILSTGFIGYVSFEFFSRTANDPSPSVPEEHAKRAQISWQRMSERMGWDSESSSQNYELNSQRSKPAAPSFLPITNSYESGTPRSLTPVTTSLRIEAH